MADKHAKVMDMIEKEILADPDISNDDLFEKAGKIDKSIKDLTARQFNAKYPLQVKRQLKAAEASTNGNETKSTKKTSKPNRKVVETTPKEEITTTEAAEVTSEDGVISDRSMVRKVLVDFARRVAEADRGELVDVMADIDSTVEQLYAHAD